MESDIYLTESEAYDINYREKQAEGCIVGVIRYPYISCLCKFGTAILTSSINFIQLFFILVLIWIGWLASKEGLMIARIIQHRGIRAMSPLLPLW